MTNMIVVGMPGVGSRHAECRARWVRRQGLCAMQSSLYAHARSAVALMILSARIYVPDPTGGCLIVLSEAYWILICLKLSLLDAAGAGRGSVRLAFSLGVKRYRMIS